MIFRRTILCWTTLRGTAFSRTTFSATISACCRTGSSRRLRRHGWGMIGSTGSTSRDNAVSAELARPRRRCHRRAAVIGGREQRAILAGRMFLLPLRCNRWRMGLVHVGFLLGSGPDLNASLPAVEGYVRSVVHDDSSVHVNIRDIRRTHIHHCRVVEECSAAPLAAAEARAVESEAVVNASVEAHRGPPVAATPGVRTVIPSPITGGPQKARLGRFHPRARNPVIAAGVIPAPIAGSP
jgi:hypothetical protein